MYYKCPNCGSRYTPSIVTHHYKVKDGDIDECEECPVCSYRFKPKKKDRIMAEDVMV